MRRPYGYPSPGTIHIGPAGPLPPVVRGLIAANTAVYLLQLVGPDEFLIELFGLIPARVNRLELWRLFTYQFLHGGGWHLIINMLMLWMFGSELEQRWGPRYFLKYYFLCAVGGGITYALVRFGTPMASVGASGAIYGILMAYGLSFPNRVVLLGFLFPVRVRHVVFFLILVELVQAIEATGTGIAYTAHLGGMAFGYAYLRWWGGGGTGLGALPRWQDLRRAYYRWRFRRMQKRRLGGTGGATYH